MDEVFWPKPVALSNPMGWQLQKESSCWYSAGNEKWNDPYTPSILSGLPSDPPLKLENS